MGVGGQGHCLGEASDQEDLMTRVEKLIPVTYYVDTVGNAKRKG